MRPYRKGKKETKNQWASYKINYIEYDWYDIVDLRKWTG